MNASRHPRKRKPIVAFSIALLLFSANALCAATLADYTTRLSRAITLIDEVKGAYEEKSGRATPEQLVAGNLTVLRQHLPATETVQLDGQNISVDNSWLYQAL